MAIDQAKLKEAQTDWDNMSTHEARLAAYAIIYLYTLSDRDSKQRIEARAKIDRMTDPYAMKKYMQAAIARGARIKSWIAMKERTKAAEETCGRDLSETEARDLGIYH